MADLKISQLTAATTPLAGTEVLPIVQSSTTKKVATDDLTVKNIRSNATTGILQIAGPAAAATRTMTTPDANFTAARTDAAQTFTGAQTVRAAATQDGIALAGRAGGTGSYAATLTPTTLSANRTITAPDADTSLPVATQVLTYSGPTAARTVTFPDANFTAARTDAAQTFTGDQTITGNVIAQVNSATSYPISTVSNRTGSGSSHVIGAFAFDAYRDVASPSYVGAIWVESVNPSYQDLTIMYLACNNTGTTSLPTATVALNNNSVGKGFYPVADNALPLGLGGNRWSVVYAGNGTINTSDANEKTDIAELDDVEKRVAVKLKSLIKKFRFKDAVALKGDGARIHVGAIAQEVAAAFVSEGLDPARYGVFCSDTFRTVNGQTVLVDSDNNYVEQYAVLDGNRIEIPAGEELPDGAEWKVVKHPTEEKTRLGLRYDQLFAFIISVL